MFWIMSHSPIFSHLQTITPSHPPYTHIQKTLANPKTPSEKYCKKPLKSRNGANSDSKGTILKYCIQKPCKSRKPPKKAIKEISLYRFQKAIHE
jgi:hypothetical protein